MPDYRFTYEGEVIHRFEVAATHYVSATPAGKLQARANAGMPPPPYFVLWLHSGRRIVVTDLALIGELRKHF
jgi:hypothetical protein